MLRLRHVLSRRDLKKFITAQWRFYENDPAWVPPLISEELKILDTRRNPFFRQARALYLLAEEDGRPVGRIAAVIDPKSNDIHNEKVCVFGFFESVNDEAVSAELFRAAAEWARENGAGRLRGPIDLSLNNRTGLLVEGYGRRPIMMMKYNPEYYAALIEQHGFEKEKDVLSFEIRVRELDDRVRRVANIAARKGYVVRDINIRDFRGELDRVRRVFNAAWEKNWGFVPTDREEFEYLGAAMKHIVVPQLGAFVEKDGELAGFGLLLPDINEILGLANGRLFPFGWLKLMRAFKKIKGVRVILLGIREEHRKRGVDAVIFNKFAESAIPLGYETCDMGWVLEENEAMKLGIVNVGGRPYRRYRIYALDL